MKVVYIVTANINKLNELQDIALEYSVRVEPLNVPKIEIQSDDLEVIASYAALSSAAIARKPLIVEDSGLFIDALNGFPGTLSSYVYKKVGVHGILNMLSSVSNRRAYFKSVIAYVSPYYEIKLFTGLVHGKIAYEARGCRGFGFDPIFIPDGSDKTFAEMELREKNKFSHRGKAFREFLNWFTKQF